MWNIKNWVTLWDGPSHHLKYRPQLKTKDKVIGHLWEVNRKSSLNYSRVGFVMQISSFLKTVLQQDSSVIKSHPFFSGTERETSLQMETSFISVNVPQKNNFYSVFRVSPVSISEKQNQLTTIFMPESPTLEWHIVLPFHSILFLYFWNVLKNLQEIKTKQNTIESSWQRSTELLLEKQLLLALSLSEGCGRRGQNTENMGLAVRTPRLRDQVGHLQVTWPRANRVPSWASGSLSVKIPALPPLEESWDS